MKVAVVAIALNEERFIGPWLQHIPDWVNTKCVLISEKPWFGDQNVYRDNTYEVAETNGAMVIKRPWESEEEQRNFGQDLFGDYDWVIVLDPDEFFDDETWVKLHEFMKNPNSSDAYCAVSQKVYWKDGWKADPDRDCTPLILVRPSVRFVDKRVVGTSFGLIDIYTHHFSWARTDMEVYEKITHYAHANDFDTVKWFNDVWKTWEPGVQDVHPTTPDTLHDFIKADLPPELERLNLWPS